MSDQPDRMDVEVQTSDAVSPVVSNTPSPIEQKRIVRELLDSANEDGVVEGRKYALVPTKWWRAWKTYSGYDSDSPKEDETPGVIDNSGLLESIDGDEVVKKTLSEMWDYEILPENVYILLRSWFRGGPDIIRPAILLSNRYKQEAVVEIRPLRLLVRRSSDMDKEVGVWFSKAASVEDFAVAMCQKFGLERENVRVWDFHAGTRHKLLDQTSKSLEEAMIIDNNKMLIEEKGEDGKFPELPSRASYASGYSSSSFSSTWSGYSSSRSPSDPGKVGLGNLGNTCFMNSALQCLSATAPLSDFFLSGKYLSELNTDNPLGMHGEIAKKYGDLLKQLWGGETYAAEPREFKWTLQRFAPQFEGYQQHDSQELLAFLLDGLHEDLNRILRKPYVAAVESEGRPDDEVAKVSWDGHKSRNDSIIVDLFQGQLKSRVQCPVCPRVSITFDPFMYLSLPLPVKSTRPLTVTLRRQSGDTAPIRFKFHMDKAASVLDLKRQIANLSGVSDPRAIVLIDVYNRRFYREIKSEEYLDTISDNDELWAYEILLPMVQPDSRSDSEDAEDEAADSPSSVSIAVLQSNGSKLINFPFVVTVPSTVTYAALYATIVGLLSRYLKRTPPPLSDQEVPEVSPMDQETPEHTVDDSSDGSMNPRASKGYVEKQPRWGGIFDVCLCDDYGTISRQGFRNDNSSLDLDSRHRLCLLWTPSSLAEFWQHDVDKDILLHPSMQRQDEDDTDSLRGLNLKDCLRLFTTEETLGANDMWYCSSCKEHRQAHKKMDIWKLPPVVVIHLKRFSYKSRYNREKIDMVVDFPLEGLDFTEFLPGNATPNEPAPLYDLFAISNHYGSMGGGHYTAYAKHRSDSRWYNYDDRSVSPVSDPSSIKTSAAYVLFYRRRDVSAFSLPFTKNPPGEDSSAETGSNHRDDTEAMEVQL